MKPYLNVAIKLLTIVTIVLFITSIIFKVQHLPNAYFMLNTFFMSLLALVSFYILRMLVNLVNQFEK